MVSPLDLFRADCRYAEQRLLRSGGLHPMAIVHGSERTIAVACPDVQDSAGDHDFFAAFVHAHAVLEGAWAVGMMSEAWILTDPDEILVRGLSPSQSSKRKEVLMVSLVWREDGKRLTVMSAREILRRKSGHVDGFGVQLGECDPNEATAEGRIVEMLPELEPSEANRTLARAFLARTDRRVTVVTIPMPKGPT